MNAPQQFVKQEPELSFWFGRFQASRKPDGTFECRDRLYPFVRHVSAMTVAGLHGDGLALALFREGFVRPTITAFGEAVRARPIDPDDTLFWQYPCVTEGAAWEIHRSLEKPGLSDGEMHVYLGLPWATWIDMERKSAWTTAGKVAMTFQLKNIGVRISGYRAALDDLGILLRVHTVCQHIYWQDMLPTWRKLGLTDLWLSHCDERAQRCALGLQVHPWSLYAVNVRDENRRSGLVIGKPPAERKTLASFMGAHSSHYLSDVREHLRHLADVPGFVVRVTDKWHFEDVVYAEQITRNPIAGSNDMAVAEYNALLSDSVFALCPTGAGPNTLRLWEALAVGTIPVLLGPTADLPQGGNLPQINWDEIVLRFADHEIPHLPDVLRAIPAAEIELRQAKALAAYKLVATQRCF